jgi:hypothetical protein
MIDLHRIGWFNHDDDELVLARFHDFNEQYLARQTESSNSPFFLHGLSLKNEDYGDYRGKDKYDSFAVAPTITSLAADFIPDATYHQVPTNSSTSSNIGALRTNIVQPTFVNQVSYSTQKSRDEVQHRSLGVISEDIPALWNSHPSAFVFMLAPCTDYQRDQTATNGLFVQEGVRRRR